MFIALNFIIKKWCNRGGYPFSSWQQVLLQLLRVSVHKLISCINGTNSESLCFTSDDNSGYYSPTTTRSGAKPSPQSLAIFVPKICLINTQQVTTGTDKKVTSSNRYIYGAGHRAVRYDGLSEPNTIPFLGNKFRRLNAIVNDPFHPFFMLDLTHNQRSGGYHA